LTGLTPVGVKAEEAAKLNTTMRDSQAHEIEYKVQPNDWLHPVHSVRIADKNDDNAIQIFTDGSKSEHGVGAGIAIFIQNNPAHRFKYSFHTKCSNNQDEQVKIVKALEKMEQYNSTTTSRETQKYTQTAESPLTHSNTQKIIYITEEIWKKGITLEKRKWTITFTLVKAHACNHGNELFNK
jgi:ribonuclease HI